MTEQELNEIAEHNEIEFNTPHNELQPIVDAMEYGYGGDEFNDEDYGY